MQYPFNLIKVCNMQVRNLAFVNGNVSQVRRGSAENISLLFINFNTTDANKVTVHFLGGFYDSYGLHSCFFPPIPAQS